MKKIQMGISIILALCMVIGLLPISAFAADEDDVAAALNSIEIAAEITKNLTLPRTYGEGVTITWVSDNDAINPSTGVVIRDGADVDVKLTATAKKGEISQSKEFTVKVKGLTSEEQATVGAILNEYTLPAKSVLDLNLPAVVEIKDQNYSVRITWTSNNHK